MEYNDLKIHQISGLSEFDALKETWGHVYAEDPHTTFFSSWAWLKGWFEATDDNWFILAVKENKNLDYVAFFPIYLKEEQLFIAGNYMADHTGFVCLPKYQDKALKALSKYIQEEIIWERLNLRDVIDPRLDIFVKNFPPNKYNLQELEKAPCPFVTLPETWENFLKGILSSSLRRDIRSKTKRIEKQDAYTIKVVREDNLENYIDILLDLWQKKWGENSEQGNRCIRSILRSCYKENSLYLPVLWDGSHPVATVAAFVDSAKKTFCDFINSGWDRRYAKYSPGLVMNGYGFRYAIEKKFLIYDFLRGAEEYKYKFGAKDRFNRHVIISKKSWKTTVKNVIDKARGVLK